LIHHLNIQDLGKIDYREAWTLQKDLVQRRISDSIENQLLLCEHNHVYTLGRSADKSNLLITPEYLEHIDAQIFEIERGGDITYHGPGQLVGYPILDLNELKMGVRTYVDLLEESLIQTLEEFGIETHRIPALTGIWLKDGLPRKIAAIGIKISRGVSMHGFALNVNTDLTYYNHIVPCGIKDKDVTTISRELGRMVDLEEVKEVYVRTFSKLFKLSESTRQT
jgi:lipoyl(octanoyl) transferase